jgi:3-phosphoshikimate 1-carboxyvinyltransferase
MLGALGVGRSEISGFLEGEDTRATLAAFRDLGVPIEQPEPGHLLIDGVGLHGLRPAAGALDLGNSGTSMRLLAGILAGQSFASTLIGDASLLRRPMLRVVEPLRLMGAQIDASSAGTAPLHIAPANGLHGIDYDSPVASAQVKSCLLLAGLYATGRTRVREPGPSRDHTERMLHTCGYAVASGPDGVELQGGGLLRASRISVPVDLSSAAFFLVGALLAPGSDLILEQVGINPTRTGILDILKLMGAQIEILPRDDVGQEPVADLRVRSSDLHGVTIPPELVPLAIDEFPILFIAAACAEGVTVVSGAAELRHKESDRIDAMAQGLTTLGVAVKTSADGIVIEGGKLGGGEIDSRGDHRVAMAFAMAALRASRPLRILDCDNVRTSFPNFVALAQSAGLDITDDRD